jgi:hypothetical protein
VQEMKMRGSKAVKFVVLKKIQPSDVTSIIL